MRRARGRGIGMVVVLLVVVVVGCSGDDHRGTAAGPGSSAVPSSVDCPAPAPTPATEPYRSIPGVDPNRVSLDVYALVDACDAPVVVWVHGGGYRTGDKANAIDDKARRFNDQGWVLVSVNYRLTDGSAGQAQYPDHYEDVAAAVAWVVDEIERYGGDPDRIALLGHSAGADIVSNVAVEPRYLQAVGLSLGALRCAAPLDTEGFDKVAAGVGDPDGEQQQWVDALGNQPDYLTSTSATRLVQPGVGIPPMIVAVRGTSRRQEIQLAFLGRLRSAGVPATELDARTLTHQDVNRRIGAPGDEVITPPLVDFLDACFR